MSERIRYPLIKILIFVIYFIFNEYWFLLFDLFRNFVDIRIFWIKSNQIIDQIKFKG